MNTNVSSFWSVNIITAVWNSYFHLAPFVIYTLNMKLETWGPWTRNYIIYTYLQIWKLHSTQHSKQYAKFCYCFNHSKTQSPELVTCLAYTFSLFVLLTSCCLIKNQGWISVSCHPRPLGPSAQRPHHSSESRCTWALGSCVNPLLLSKRLGDMPPYQLAPLGLYGLATNAGL